MNQEPNKSNTVLIIIAIIGVAGTIIAAAIGAIGNYNTEVLRQNTELTRIALLSTPTQGNVPTTPIAQTLQTQQETHQEDTPLAALALYDSFDNSIHDGYYNQGLWVFNDEVGNVAIQQDNGSLTLQVSESNIGVGSWINLANGEDVSLQDYNAIEAKFSWDSQIKGELYLGLSAQQSWTPKVAYICDFVLVEGSSVLHCEGSDDEQVHTPNIRSLAPNRVYTLRIEIDPATAIFTIYLDGTVIDTYSPPDPEKWREGLITYNVHLGGYPDSSGVIYIDDVRFGKIK